MSDFVPTTEQVRQAYEVAHEEVGASYEPDEFDRWFAEVERAAAEKAWERCIDEMPIDPDWKNFYGDNNPYAAEAYRQEREE